MYCCVSLAFVVPYCNVGWLRLFWVPSTVQHQIPELQYCKGCIQETKTIIFGWHHDCPHLLHSFLLSARSWKRSRCSCWSSWRPKALRWQRNKKMEMRFGRGTGPWRSLRRTGCCIPHLLYRWYCMYSTVLYPFQSRFPNISIQYCTYRIYCIYCIYCTYRIWPMKWIEMRPHVQRPLASRMHRAKKRFEDRTGHDTPITFFNMDHF